MDFFKEYFDAIEKQYKYAKNIADLIQKTVEQSIDKSFEQVKKLAK
jgi:hypothetical protein